MTIIARKLQRLPLVDQNVRSCPYCKVDPNVKSCSKVAEHLGQPKIQSCYANMLVFTDCENNQFLKE